MSDGAEGPADTPPTATAPPADAASTAVVQRGRPFQPGQSGNPAGRPKGSRNRLTEVFMSAVADDFTEHGAEVIAQVRRGDPVAYLRIVGSFVPPELVLKRETEPNVDIENLSFADYVELLERLERCQAIRRALLAAERG
jgi:hypothetical protein